MTKITTMSKPSKSKMEFSQKLVIISWIVTIIWISLSYLLALLNKDTNSTVTVTLITETFGVTIAYFIYQATLKTNRNKHGISCDGVPYSIKQKMESILGEPDSDTDNADEINEVNEEGVG